MTTALVKQPIYQQLNEALRTILGSGEFKTGARFLTEREVSHRFEVSRATANKALSNLVSEGILEFKKGIGTFVRGGVLDYDLRSLVSFTGKAAAAGKRPSTRVLAFDEIFASKVAARITVALRVREGDRLYTLERLRLADGVPVILERRWVATAHCPGLERAHLDDSLYALWIRKYGLKLEGADQSIRAVGVSRGDARLLRVKPGSAALLVTSTGRLEGGEPLWFERTLYRGDAYEFQNRLGGLRSARPAIGALVEA